MCQYLYHNEDTVYKEQFSNLRHQINIIINMKWEKILTKFKIIDNSFKLWENFVRIPNNFEKKTFV